ncbi:MAG: TonB-dependent receptor [Sphingobacteriaceae bacterium]|nr:MAG: TonB-dependent receptor [Sphingobacteriaceae bacterium]
MNKKIILVWLLTVFTTVVNAQALLTIKGTVKDSKGAAIPAASVRLLNTNFSTSANNKGEFTLVNVAAGTYNMETSAIGFAATSQVINITSANTPINIQLAASGSQLDEVVVSAEKRDEQAQRLPLSVSALSSKQIQDYRVWNAKDITGIVPNLFSAGPGDNRNVTSIRGITTTSYDPAVATYIDGVNQFGLDTYIAQLLDVDRIEVLRGPQGTLYGRNATGGVINIITKQPTNQTSGYVNVDFGNYNLQRYTLGFRAPLIKDKLFLGVSGIYSSTDGYYTNTFNNTKFDKQHYYLGNYYLKYLASSRLSFTLNVKHNSNRNNGPFALAPDPVTALSQPFKVNQNATTTLFDDIFNASLTANYIGRGFNFTSQTSYQQNYRYYNNPIDGDFSPLDIITINNNFGKAWNNVKTGIQEFRFSSPTSSVSPLKWTAGVYGFINSQPNRQSTRYGAQAALYGAPPNATSTNTNTANNYGTAVFGQATYTISPQVDITGGIRYDYEHRKAFVNGTYKPDASPVAFTTAPDQTATASFRAFSPKVSIAYHPAENNTLYASYSRGYRAGGFSQLTDDPSAPALDFYKPEYSNNYEVGTKNTFWDKKARLNVTAFYTLLTDAQVPFLDQITGFTFTRNVGRLNSKGVELEFAATPVKGLEFDYNFGYTNAKYTQGVTNGNRQIFTPDVTSMLAMQYTHDLGGKQDFKLVGRGEWKYLGDQYFDLGNTIKQNAYHLFNARVGVTSKCFDVFLWANNIFNKRYIDYAYNFGASHLGNPAIYGVSLRAKF